MKKSLITGGVTACLLAVAAFPASGPASAQLTTASSSSALHRDKGAAETAGMLTAVKAQETRLSQCMARHGKKYDVTVPADVARLVELHKNGGDESRAATVASQSFKTNPNTLYRESLPEREAVAYDQAFGECAAQENALVTESVTRDVNADLARQHVTFQGNTLTLANVPAYIDAKPHVAKSLAAAQACIAGKGFGVSTKDELLTKVNAEASTIDADDAFAAVENCYSAYEDAYDAEYELLFPDEN